MNGEPTISFKEPSADEERQVFLLRRALGDMGIFANNFLMALQLFEYCLTHLSNFHWALVAARDATVSIYNFRNAMLAANEIAIRLARLVPHLDREALRAAHRAFEESFPDYAKLRHGVAHAGEVFKSKESYEAHAHSGDYRGRPSPEVPGIVGKGPSRGMIRDLLQGSVFTTTYDGAVRHLDMSAPTLTRLQAIQAKFYEAFRRVPSPVEP